MFIEKVICKILTARNLKNTDRTQKAVNNKIYNKI